MRLDKIAAYLLLFLMATAVGCKDSHDGNPSVRPVPKPGPVALDKEARLLYGKAGEPYRTALGVSGGSGSYSFALEDGAKLPAGLKLDEKTGIITGSVASDTRPGDYGFNVRVRDGAPGGEKFTDTAGFFITVDNRPFEWTVIAHFAVDNNISTDMEKEFGLMTDYLETLEKVKAADKENRIRIVLLLDGEKSSGFKDGYYYLTGGKIADDLIKPMQEFNSGDPAITKTFMNWAIKDRAASSHYFYTIFNHGGGFDDPAKDGIPAADGEDCKQSVQMVGNSIGYDDSHNADSLSHYELGILTTYLKNLTGKKIDLFYTFACLMGGVELAYEVKDAADYILFSEESFPADKWSYEALQGLASNPTMPVTDLGKAFCDSSYDYFSKLDGGIEFTLSMVDLSKMDALYDAADEYAAAALTDIGSDRDTAARYNQVAHGSFSVMDYELETGQSFYYMDLGDYLDRIKTADGIAAAVKAKAAALKTAYTDSLIYERHFAFDGASGMYIFHNAWDNESPGYDPSIYADILKFGRNRWAAYQKKMTELGRATGQGSH